MEKTKAFAESIFTKYEVRYSRKEKDAFLAFCKAEFAKLGYGEAEITVQQSKLGGKNFVAGPPDADILFTAHYDTPGNNGYFSLPGRSVFGHVLSSFLSLLIVLVIFAVPYLFPPEYSFVFNMLILILIVFLFGVKNKHNHNDNSSGVISVFNMAENIAENPELRGKCAFALFDNEEKMLLGSMAFAKWRRKNYPEKINSPVINFDCVGAGDKLLVASKNDHDNWHKMAEFLQNEGFEVSKKRSGMLLLSDDASFQKGVFLAFMQKSKLGYMYYPNIHTKKDTVCDVENIGRLCASVYKYVSGVINV